MKRKNLYSLLYYNKYGLFYRNKPTNHYIEEHEKEVPWNKVVKIILTTKNPRKKGDKFEIEKDDYII